MKIKILLGVLVVAAIAAFFAYVSFVQPALNNRTVQAVVNMPIVNDDLAFSFSYPSGQDAFTLIEPPVATTSTELRKVYLIMNTGEYLDFANNTEPQEAPAAMSVFVAPAPSSETVTGGRVARLQQWAMDNPQYSSFNLKTSEVEVVEIDGTQAIRYDASGLYEQHVYVVFYDGNIYAFIGQYHTPGDEFEQAFTNLMSTVAFN